MGDVEYSGIQKLFNVCLKRMKRRFSEQKSLKGKQRWNDFYVGIQGFKEFFPLSVIAYYKYCILYWGTWHFKIFGTEVCLYTELASKVLE